MPEMSFGRSIRYRRNKLGLSQSRLGELVGRSGAAVRSWERDSSTPTDPGVLQALAAILGVEKHVLFEKAGVEVPALETAPTVEQVLGSLTHDEEQVREEVASQTEDHEDASPIEDVYDYSGDGRGNADEMQEIYEIPDEVSPAPMEPMKISVVASPADIEPFADSTPSPTPPAFTSNPPRYLFTTPAPPVPEPTYMEDESQRQVYRIRNLATLVIVVGLVVLFVWALGNGWQAFTDWWDNFLSTLEL